MPEIAVGISFLPVDTGGRTPAAGRPPNGGAQVTGLAVNLRIGPRPIGWEDGFQPRDNSVTGFSDVSFSGQGPPMRLGIRNKLVATLVIVGLIPMALSLLTIISLGARTRLTTISRAYDATAAAAGHAISLRIRMELRRLVLLASLPEVIQYTHEQDKRNAPPLGQKALQPDALARRIEKSWSTLTPQTDPLRQILHNPIALRMRLISRDLPRRYHLLATDHFGHVIAADIKPSNYLQQSQSWWKICDQGVRGRAYVSSIIQDVHTNAAGLVIAVPIRAATGECLGFIRETLGIETLRRQFKRSLGMSLATLQIYDHSLKTTVFVSGNVTQEKRANRRFFDGTEPGLEDWINDLTSGAIIGSARIRLTNLSGAAAAGTTAPVWSIIVSQPTSRALSPILSQAATLMFAGLLLMISIMAVGYVMSQREIIQPILRLRDATAAVRRGELSIRILSDATGKSIFRDDELGLLARDFETMTRDLQHKIIELQSKESAKLRFLDLAAHELLTPTTKIKSSAELLQLMFENAAAAGGAQSPDEKRRIDRYFKQIAESVQRLTRYINYFYELAAHDQFTTRIRREPCNIHDIILNVVDQNRDFIIAREQEIVLNVPDNLPVVQGDPDKIADILDNLLRNANQFSPPHSRIEISASRIVGGRVELMVHDQGAGISPEKIANLFSLTPSAAQVMHHRSGGPGLEGSGLGLGLLVAKRFAEYHDGKLRVESGQSGTRIYVELPINEDSGDFPLSGASGGTLSPSADAGAAPDGSTPQKAPNSP